MRTDVQEQYKYILEYLAKQNNSLATDIEIIANMLIALGAEQIPEIPPDQAISHQELMTFLRNDRANHGETIGNALAYQGLTMLMWLERGKK